MFGVDDRIVQVADKYYYTLVGYKDTRGPFESYAEAVVTITADLERMYGSKKITINQRC